MSNQEIMELQNTIIENQKYIIQEIMKLYCIEPSFEIDDRLQAAIRQNNQLMSILNTPGRREVIECERFI